MAKKRSSEVDEQALQAKIKEKMAAPATKSNKDPALRSLRRRLRRAQRKRRMLERRKKMGVPAKAEAPTSEEAAG